MSMIVRPAARRLVAALLPLSLVATACIGERRPQAQSEAQAAPAAPKLVLAPEEVDDRLSAMVEGDRAQVLYTETEPLTGAELPLVTIVEFSDFQCPFCGRLAETLEEIAQAHPEDVRLVFKQFPLPMHKDAEPGARAALAAQQQGRFWEMHDKLFENPRTMSESDLHRYASEIGLDLEKFKADLAAPATAEKVEQDLEQGRKLAVRSTPTFFVNGRLVTGAKPAAEIEAIVAEEIALAQKLIEAGSERGEVYARIMKAAKPAEG